MIHHRYVTSGGSWGAFRGELIDFFAENKVDDPVRQDPGIQVGGH